MSDALDVMSSLVLEDGRRWGDAALDFQWSDARATLDQDALPYQFLTRGRGGSKTADLAGLSVAAMLTQAPVGARGVLLGRRPRSGAAVCRQRSRVRGQDAGAAECAQRRCVQGHDRQR